jgi:hypothetical protein
MLGFNNKIHEWPAALKISTGCLSFTVFLYYGIICNNRKTKGCGHMSKKLQENEIILLSAILSTHYIDDENLTNICMGAKEKFLQLKQTFEELNKSELSFNTLARTKRKF